MSKKMIKSFEVPCVELTAKKQTWPAEIIHEYARILSTYKYLFRGRFND